MTRLILSAAITAGFAAAASADQQLATVIRKQAAGQEERSAVMKCQFRHTQYRREGASEHSSEINVQISGAYYRQQNTFIEKDGGKRRLANASGMTARYVYSLKHANGTWVLTSLAVPRVGKARFIYAMEYSHASSLWNCTYRSLLSAAKTRIVGEQAVEWRGRKHRELVLDAENPRDLVRRRYGLFVLPEQAGVVRGIREYDPANLSKWLTEEVIEYQPGDDPFPTVKSVEMFVTDKTANYEPWRYTRYEIMECSRSREALPEQAFSLSTFGLPEPRTIPLPPPLPFSPQADINMVSASPAPPETVAFRYWHWVIIGVILLLAVLLYRIRRSRIRTP